MVGKILQIGSGNFDETEMETFELELEKDKLKYDAENKNNRATCELW